ncbi:MAG: enoyl-CoA hydratase/isomerase family protein [Acidianus sp.]|nr:enoyl-CoA hydratase/isomerase family protein [Acidianus sp.]
MTKVIYKNEGLLSWIIFNREEKLNALDMESWAELGDSLRKADEDPSMAIIITGKGRAFSAGDDIYAMEGLSNADEAEKFFSTLYSAIKALIEVKKPVIALVNGLAYGGGCEILLLSDIVISSEDAVFSISEGKLGLIPPMACAIGYKALGRRITRLLLTTEAITAREAKEIGLVDYVVPKEKIIEELDKVVKMISQLDVNSIRSMKAWTRADLKMIEKAVKELSLLCLTSSAKDRMREFISKHTS